MQRIISKRLVTVAAMVAMVLTIAVPTFAQVLPQSDPGVTSPAAGEESVPNQEDVTSPDVTSTEPSSSTEDGALPITTTDATNNPAAPAGGSETDVIPIKLSSELCADVTDPLVVGTFEQVLPEVVQGCQERASIPAGTAPVNPAPVDPAPTNDKVPVKPAPTNDMVPAEPAPVEPAPIETTPPNQATSVYP
jgi:molecular chaperone DnaK